MGLNRSRQTLFISGLLAARKTMLHKGHSSVLRSTIIQKIMAKNLIRFKKSTSMCRHVGADKEHMFYCYSDRANYWVNQHVPQRHHEDMTSLCSSKVDTIHWVRYDMKESWLKLTYCVLSTSFTARLNGLWTPNCPTWFRASYWQPWQLGLREDGNWYEICFKVDKCRVFKLPLSLCISSTWARATKSSPLKYCTQIREVVSQVMVHRSVVKVLGFACTPHYPSFSGGGRYGWLWDAGG